jgi:hypothetical protein
MFNFAAMRKFITRLVLPITILAFALLTKWWHVFVPDIGNEVMYGFPFIYKCRGWHTSVSTQYFVLEFIADFVTYFIICFAIIYIIRRRIKFRIARTVSLLLWVTATLAITVAEFWLMMPETVYHTKSKFEVKVHDTGFHLNYQPKERPE